METRKERERPAIPIDDPMSPAYDKRGNGSRNKLGLSLAGGGFRATLYHLGVLHRMAELDLLRFVEVLSTVSGGSIIGALYTLLLKKYLRDVGVDGDLSREDYMALVKELDDTLTRAIKRNLRALLFLNPLGMLRVMLTEQSLGKRMARIYERHIYNKVVCELEGKRFKFWHYLNIRPGRILLKEIRPLPGGAPLQKGIDEYNADAATSCKSVVTKLVLNATTLNSGSRFWFSSNELGDWKLGHFRHSEINALLHRKRYLQSRTLSSLKEHLLRAQKILTEGTDTTDKDYRIAKKDNRTLSLIFWWRQNKQEKKKQAKKREVTIDPAVSQMKRSSKIEIPPRWKPLFDVVGFPGRLEEIEPGFLRLLKIPAWYILEGVRRSTPVKGGFTLAEHMDRLWAVFGEIDEPLADRIQALVEGDESGEMRDLFLEFILEFYWIRTAEVVSPRIDKDWEHLTLGEAVGASACFPPVFPPYTMLGIYDDSYVTRLGLTDGGVYDNIGLQALLDERCNYIIASDTSGLFDIEQRAANGRISMLARIVNILMNAVAVRQREQLRDRRRVTRAIDLLDRVPREVKEFHGLRELKGLAFFHIRSKTPKIEGLALEVDRNKVANIRTDLDSFGDVEIAALVNTGYDSADRYIRKYLQDLDIKNAWTKPKAWPKKLGDKKKADRILDVAPSNFFRSIKLFGIIPILVSLTGIAGLFWYTWSMQFSLDGLLSYLGNALMAWFDEGMPFFKDGWTEVNVHTGKFILSVSAGIIGLRLISGWMIAWLREKSVSFARKLAFGLKWIRSYAGNILWFFGWLPAVIVGFISTIAIIGYVFYNLTFLWKTRVE